MNQKVGTLLREKILALAIAVVFVFFIGFGASVFLGEPRYQDYCEKETYGEVPQNEESCTQVGGKWDSSVGRPPLKVEDSGGYLGYCDVAFGCRENYDAAKTQVNYITFIVTIIAGIVAIYFGINLAVESVSSGLVGGGTLSIIYGSFFRLFPELPNIGRFILLGIALAILIYIGYKKFGYKK